MHAEFFLDTNILLYAASGAVAEKAKRAVARELLARDGGGLSVQVLAEFYVNATAKFKLPEDKVIRILESLENYPVLPISDRPFFGRRSPSKSNIRFHTGIVRSSPPRSNSVARPPIPRI